jgi:hypothetical protein
VFLLRDSCRVLNITPNPFKYITVNNAADSSSAPEARFIRFMKLAKFRQELNITSFVVYHRLKVV